MAGTFSIFIRLHPIFIEYLKVAVGLSRVEAQFSHVSFVNSIATSKGGTHVNYVTDQIVKCLHERIVKKFPDLDARPNHVRNQLFVFVSCLVENPTFDSQVFL